MVANGQREDGGRGFPSLSLELQQLFLHLLLLLWLTELLLLRVPSAACAC